MGMRLGAKILSHTRFGGQDSVFTTKPDTVTS
jgi:hypothetical protein